GGSGGLVAGLLAFVLSGGAAAFFILGGKKKDETPKTTPQAPPSSQGPPISSQPKGPTERPKTPPPMPSVAIQEQIKATGPQLQDLVVRAQALYDEAMAARESGNDKLWQDKLSEARAAASEGNEIYNNVIIANMTSNDDYNEEEAAQYFINKGERWIDGPAKAIAKIQDVMSKMKASQRR
ncbi:MAG: hypothetical protein AB7T63_15140, partial [Planctomycetota bacterium]